MRAAPAVDALLADGRQVRWLILALHLGAMTALLAWVAAWLWPARASQSPAGMAPLAWLLGVASLASAGGLGRWQARRLLPPGPRGLRWDGQAWQWLVDGQALPLAAVAVQIDLGPQLLLRLQHVSAQRQVFWALASARAAGRDWHGLRVALHYHAGVSPAPATAPGLRADGSAANR